MTYAQNSGGKIIRLVMAILAWIQEQSKPKSQEGVTPNDVHVSLLPMEQGIEGGHFLEMY
ncbi:MAG: hypothetical protein FWH27_05295 [Planctomycetaceae bacterium]|nr:hypothetical protein [Planctomycetaceae bacterium]